MSNHLQNLVAEFNRLCDVDMPDASTPLDLQTAILRIRLITEESHEFSQEAIKGKLAESIKELVDILYVTYGALLAMGIHDVTPFFEEVHHSNMSKVWADGTVHKREDGKILKPDSYMPANIQGILNAMARLDELMSGEFVKDLGTTQYK